MFSGLQLYDIAAEPDGITLRGQISTVPKEFEFPVYYGWTRGIFVGDMVYAMTEHSIQQAALDAPDDVLASLELSELVDFVDDIVVFEDGVVDLPVVEPEGDEPEDVPGEGSDGIDR